MVDPNAHTPLVRFAVNLLYDKFSLDLSVRAFCVNAPTV